MKQSETTFVLGVCAKRTECENIPNVNQKDIIGLSSLSFTVVWSYIYAVIISFYTLYNV